jgi:hypothetical protein
MAVGNHEFDKPLTTILQQRDWAGFPFISANIYDKETNERVFPSHIVKELDDLKITIFGLTTEDTPLKSNPKNSQHLKFVPVIEEAKKLVPLLTNITKISASIGDTIVNLVVKAADSRVGKWASSKFGGMEKFVSWIKDFFKVKVPKLLAYMISLLASLNPTAAAGSVDDISIKKFGKETAKTKASEEVVNKITNSGKKEVLASGISPSDKYKKFQSPEQEFQRDTTHDLKTPILPNIKKA